MKRLAIFTSNGLSLLMFRTDIFTLCDETMEPVIQELSIDEIINGIPGTEYQVNIFSIANISTSTFEQRDIIYTNIGI